jgi:hypothetical protein
MPFLVSQFNNFFKNFFFIFSKIIFDLKFFYLDSIHIGYGFYNDFSKGLFLKRIKLYITHLNDLRKYFLKKHIYTINHKRIALNYFYFSM